MLETLKVPNRLESKARELHLQKKVNRFSILMRKNFINQIQKFLQIQLKYSLKSLRQPLKQIGILMKNYLETKKNLAKTAQNFEKSLKTI